MRVRVTWNWIQAELYYPPGRPPRTALLVPWVRATGLVRYFGDGWDHSARSYNPEVLAGTWIQLRQLSTLARPAQGLVVLARPGEPLLDHVQREQLWQAYQVPVYEQVIGRRGALLAFECQAHDGLHVARDVPEFQAYALDTSVCGCGRTSPRLVTPRAKVRMAAAG